jgi:hypothetical protein
MCILLTHFSDAFHVDSFQLSDTESAAMYNILFYISLWQMILFSVLDSGRSKWQSKGYFILTLLNTNKFCFYYITTKNIWDFFSPTFPNTWYCQSV